MNDGGLKPSIDEKRISVCCVMCGKSLAALVMDRGGSMLVEHEVYCKECAKPSVGQAVRYKNPVVCAWCNGVGGFGAGIHNYDFNIGMGKCHSCKGDGFTHEGVIIDV